jgi:hypothetical protein
MLVQTVVAISVPEGPLARATGGPALHDRLAILHPPMPGIVRLA